MDRLKTKIWLRYEKNVKETVAEYPGEFLKQRRIEEVNLVLNKRHSEIDSLNSRMNQEITKMIEELSIFCKESSKELDVLNTSIKDK